MAVMSKDELLALVRSMESAQKLNDVQVKPLTLDEAAGVRINIRYLRASRDGEAVCVGVELGDPSRNLREQRRLLVRTELFGDLELSCREISPDELQTLEDAARLSEAIYRGISMLSCTSNSGRMLTQKLRARGFDAEVAARTVEHLAAKGYLREENDACRVAEQAFAKGWGMRRIVAHLHQKGYDTAAIAVAREALAEEDFEAACAALARKKSRTPPGDSNEKQKLIAFLMRYGYESSEIRAALRIAWEE